MANEKQDGSNVINAEWSTGRCPTRCEQCFVNFGQQGKATCRDIVSPGETRKKTLEWRRQVGRTTGLYTPPPPLPRGLRARSGRQLLLASITEKGTGFNNIPTTEGAEPWVIKKSSADKKKNQTIDGLNGRFPFFLRVSSMSDASWAPPEWVRAVREAWGDYCFFNSSIRAVKSAKGNSYRRRVFDEYHKLVVTVNPGYQAVNPMRPAVDRPNKKKDRKKEAAVWAAENKWNALNSMGKSTQAKPRDFLHPETLTDLGLAEYEDTIKFYRERALPTVRARFETDRPVVVTQMRFCGIDHLLEFCRRYKLKSRIVLPSRYLLKSGDLPAYISRKVSPFSSRGLTEVTFDRGLPRPRVHIWSTPKDKRNASPYAGEHSIYEFWSSYHRPLDIDYFDADPYVCDRLHGGCANCGLCATLDGTQEENTNWLNVMPNGELWGPWPYRGGAGYLGSFSPEATEFFDGVMDDQLGGDWDPWEQEEAEYFIFRENPAEPADMDDIDSILRAASRYVTPEKSYFCEGWNTHENAAAAVAYAVWSLIVHAKRAGMTDPDDGIDWVLGSIADMSRGADVTAGVVSPIDLWFDNSPWIMQFGPTDV